MNVVRKCFHIVGPCLQILVKYFQVLQKVWPMTWIGPRRNTVQITFAFQFGFLFNKFSIFIFKKTFPSIGVFILTSLQTQYKIEIDKFFVTWEIFRLWFKTLIELTPIFQIRVSVFPRPEFYVYKVRNLVLGFHGGVFRLRFSGLDFHG